MTDDLEPSNFHDGDHDPAIAERFRVLERATPPSDALTPMAAAGPGASRGSEPSGRRTGFLLAVAATVGVLLVGVVAVVAVNRGDDGSERTEEAVAADAADDDDADVADEEAVETDDSSDTTAALVIDGADGDRSTTRPAPEDGSEQDNGSEDGAGGDTDSNPSVSSNGVTDPGASGSPVTTVPGESAADGDRPVSTFTSETTDKIPPDGGGDGGDPDPEMVSLRGTVTEVFTDCQSRLVLNESGQVVERGPVSCDGGSYIVVDGTRVFTSSGFTSADLAYDKHPSNLKPGLQVSVTASPFGGSGGPLSLACDRCSLRIG